MNFWSTAEQDCSYATKPAPAVFPGLCIVTEAAGQFQFGQLKLESETSNLMHITSKVLATNYI